MLVIQHRQQPVFANGKAVKVYIILCSTQGPLLSNLNPASKAMDVRCPRVCDWTQQVDFKVFSLSYSRVQLSVELVRLLLFIWSDSLPPMNRCCPGLLKRTTILSLHDRASKESMMAYEMALCGSMWTQPVNYMSINRGSSVRWKWECVSPPFSSWATYG